MLGNRFAGLLSLAVLGLGMLIFSPPAQAEILGDYVTVNACNECHEEHVASWSKTAHARAWDSLKTQGKEKQSIPGCIKCHVVAYEQDGGFIDMDLTPEFINVQCENCHGPGRKHAEGEGEGPIISKPAEASCRACHTEGQDKNFDYAQKSKLVHPQ